MTVLPAYNRTKLYTEILAKDGPTGRYCEVLRAEIRDHGGNRLSTATTRRGLTRAENRWRIPTVTVPVKLGREVPRDAVDPDGLI